jgi:methyl-accepting chemotaxis protein
MTFKKSITAKFIAAVFAVLLAGQILGTVLFILTIRASLFDSLEVRIRKLSVLAAGVCAGPLLSHDYPLIETFLEDVTRDEEIISVHITDKAGNIMREKVKSEKISQEGMNPFFFMKTLSVKAPVIASGEKIGEITIEYSAFKINKDISRNMIVISLYQLVLLVVVSFVMMLLFRKNITNPIFSINRVIEKITSGDLSTPVPDLGENEIGDIAKGIAFLEARLFTIIAKLNSTAVNVSMAAKQVDHAYNNVLAGITTQTSAVKTIISSMQNASKAQVEISAITEKLSSFSAENVSSLLEVKVTSEEIAANVQRLFKATEDSYSVVVQMNQAAKAIAENAASASSAVEDTSASVEEVGASVREVEEHARESAKLAETVREVTSNVGMMSVVNAVEGMENISEEVKKSAEIIQRLGIRSGDIEKILSVIKDVTEQTNLLSLNAAILAAQAGEYGKSFSVVADEIRGLSERTSSSTREIGGIVKNIQSDIRDAVYTIDTAQEKVAEGNTLVIKVGEALGEILNTAIHSTEMTKAIERATEEQSLGLKQISVAIENIRKMMSSVAKSTKEQDSALSYLLEGTGEVKEVAELSKRGTFEQAEGTKLISRNLELANDRINQISEAIVGQKKLHNSIIDAMGKIGDSGTSSIQDMEDVSVSLKTLAQEIEAFRQDMEVFKIK